MGGIDRLGYKYYAEAQLKMLKKADQPICIGLYGRQVLSVLNIYVNRGND